MAALSQYRLRRLVPLLLYLLCALVLLYLQPSRLTPHDDPRPSLVVSLASSSRRLNSTLPVTLWSLLRQAGPELERIHVYLPEQEEDLVAAVLHEEPAGHARGDGHLAQRPLSPAAVKALQDPRVAFHFVRDQGPATKFLPIVQHFLSLASSNDRTPLDQLILVVDDDHAYSPTLLSSFLDAARSPSTPPDVALALRGWRVREDLVWGVGGQAEYSNHVVEGWKLGAPFQVGVATANEGYLIRPRLFLPDAVLASSPLPPDLASHAPLFNYTSAPPSSVLVDDIWINGQLAFLSRSRLVLPLAGAPSFDLTSWRPKSERPLEGRMGREGIDRGQANGEMLHWFGAALRKEGIPYRFLSVGGGRAWVRAEGARLATRWVKGKIWEWRVLSKWGELRGKAG